MQIIDRWYGQKKKREDEKENRLSFYYICAFAIVVFFVTVSMTTFQTHLFVRVLCHFSFDSTS